MFVRARRCAHALGSGNEPSRSNGAGTTPCLSARLHVPPADKRGVSLSSYRQAGATARAATVR